MAKHTKRKAVSSAEVDQCVELFQAVLEAPASVSATVLDDIEKAFGTNHWGPTRRAALAFMSKTGREQMEIFTDSRSGAVAIATLDEGVREYSRQLRALADIMDAASARILLGLAQREDMSEVIEEATSAT